MIPLETVAGILSGSGCGPVNQLIVPLHLILCYSTILQLTRNQMIIPDREAVTRINTSIGHALMMVVTKKCVRVKDAWSWTSRITPGTRTKGRKACSLKEFLWRIVWNLSRDTWQSVTIVTMILPESIITKDRKCNIEVIITKWLLSMTNWPEKFTILDSRVWMTAGFQYLPYRKYHD